MPLPGFPMQPNPTDPTNQQALEMEAWLRGERPNWIRPPFLQPNPPIHDNSFLTQMDRGSVPSLSRPLNYLNPWGLAGMFAGSGRATPPAANPYGPTRPQLTPSPGAAGAHVQSAMDQYAEAFAATHGNMRPGAANIPPPGSRPTLEPGRPGPSGPTESPEGVFSVPPVPGVRPDTGSRPPPSDRPNPFGLFTPGQGGTARDRPPPLTGLEMPSGMGSVTFPPVPGGNDPMPGGPSVLPMPAPELPDLSGAGIYPGAENYMRQQRSPAPRRQRGQRSSLLDILDQVALLT